ncbi:MAG: sigma-70 family RNA polymerase sigma factor [Myxococcales bacterium FL481]|nr:MAG: sigma-70 family RNA polymerase sigma factor [Myxococcales bacterium FL481]
MVDHLLWPDMRRKDYHTAPRRRTALARPIRRPPARADGRASQRTRSGTVGGPIRRRARDPPDRPRNDPGVRRANEVGERAPDLPPPRRTPGFRVASNPHFTQPNVQTSETTIRAAGYSHHGMDGPHLPESSPATTPAQFDDVCRDNASFVRAVVRHHGIPDHSVDDLTQDVLVTAWLIRHRLHSPAGARAWLRRIALYCASNWKRSRSRSLAKHQTYAMLPQCPRSVQDAERLATRRELEFFLSLLDDAKRQAFVLTEAYGMTATEIARELDLNDNTVRSRLHKARQALRSVTLAMDASESVAIEARMIDLLREKVRAAKRRSDDELLAILPAPALFDVTVGPAAASGGSAVPAGPAAAAPTASPATSGLFKLVAGLGLTVASASAATWAMTQEDGQVAAIAQEDPRTVVAAIDAASLAPEAPPAEPPAEAATDAPAAAPAAEPQDTAPSRRRSVDRSLGAETRLIDSALAAEGRGDLRSALARLRRHERDFAAGQLVPARAGSMVRVLCGLERHREAKRVAQRHHLSPQAAEAARAAFRSGDCRKL